MKNTLKALLLAIAVYMPPAPPMAHAQGLKDRHDAVDRIVLGYAKYNAIEWGEAYKPQVFHLEARIASIPVWKTHPWLGLEIGENGEHHILAGLESDIALWDAWVLTLQLGGGYLEDGDKNFNRDDYPRTGLSFRSQIELGYAFENGYRLSLGFSHTSNAGYKMPNPGGEQISVNAHLPVKSLLGRD